MKVPHLQISYQTVITKALYRWMNNLNNTWSSTSLLHPLPCRAETLSFKLNVRLICGTLIITKGYKSFESFPLYLPVLMEVMELLTLLPFGLIQHEGHTVTKFELV